MVGLHRRVRPPGNGSGPASRGSPDAALDGLKFSDLLPRDLARGTLAARLVDPNAVERLLGWEPVMRSAKGHQVRQPSLARAASRSSTPCARSRGATDLGCRSGLDCTPTVVEIPP